jgi:hypothetical protein
METGALKINPRFEDRSREGKDHIMDFTRFDRWTRALTAATSRRTTLIGLALGGFALASRPNSATAGKKSKKLKRNAFGCVDVGNACRGKDGNCCSGICQGKKPKKGKKDTSRCIPHNVLGCQVEQDQCAGTPAQCGSNPMGVCYRTTGNASYCGVMGACFECKTDADCEAAGGFGAGAACVVCANECAPTGGTACFAAAP